MPEIPPIDPAAEASRDRLAKDRAASTIDVRNTRSNDRIKYADIAYTLPAMDRLIHAAENTMMSNARILTNLDEMKTMFSQFSKDNHEVRQIKKEASLRDSNPVTSYTIQDIEDPVRQAMALKKYKEFKKEDATSQLRRLEDLGILDKEGVAKLGDKQFAGEQVKEALQRISGHTEDLQPATKDIDSLVQSLQSRVEQGILQDAAHSNLTLYQRAQRAALNAGSKIIPHLGGHAAGMHGMHGLITPRMPTTVAGTPIARGAAASAGEGLAEGAAAGAIEGQAVGAVTRLLGTAVGGAIPVLGLAMMAGEILPHIKNYIPLYSQFQQMRRMGVEAENLGAITGEGRGAGYAAMREARDLRGGMIGATFHGLLHPFDPITNQIANEIVTSVRTQGFTGRQGREFQQATASLYRDLRLPIDQTTQLLADAVRKGGESLGQITHEMHGFDDAAHALQMNIHDYAASILATSATLREAGAGPVATRVAQTLTAGLPQPMRGAQGVNTVLGAMDAVSPFIMARTHLTPSQLGTPGALPQQLQAYESVLRDGWTRAKGNNIFEKAKYASMYLPEFQNLNPEQVRLMMERITHGRGPGSIVALDHARDQYSRRIRRLAGGHSRQMTGQEILKMGRAEAGRLGVNDREWNQIQEDMKGRGLFDTHHYAVSGAIDTSAISARQLHTLRENTIRGLRGTLTDKQRAELRSHIDDRHWSFDKAIKRYEEGRGRLGSGSSVDVNGVTITLKGKAAKLLDITGPNKDQAARGLRPTNTMYDTENQRLSTGF